MSTTEGVLSPLCTLELALAENLEIPVPRFYPRRKEAQAWEFVQNYPGDPINRKLEGQLRVKSSGGRPVTASGLIPKTAMVPAIKKRQTPTVSAAENGASECARMTTKPERCAWGTFLALM